MSLVRLLWLTKLIFGVTVKENTRCHLGLTETQYTGSQSVTVVSVLFYSPPFGGYT